LKPVDRVVATLYHEEPDKVPFNEFFCQPQARDLFFRPSRTGVSGVKTLLKETKWWGRDIVRFGINADALLSEVIVHDPSRKGYSVVKGAWGSIYFGRRIPSFSKTIHSSIHWPEDLDRIEIPSLDKYKPKIKALARDVKIFRKAGYFVEAFHNGPFVMTWARLRGLTNFLMDIVRDPVFAKRLVDFAMSNQLELTKAIIDEAKPHAIRLGNDMGTKENLFFSPQAYNKIFNPWEKKLVKEYHKRDVFVFHHCHGNINLIFKDIVETGIDAIDPLDPYDGINLIEIKEKYGDKITLRGGIGKYVGEYNKKQIYEHVVDRLKIGSPGGGFIIQSSGGLLHTMGKENIQYYKKIIKKMRNYDPNI
jgi:hypothetical protein